MLLHHLARELVICQLMLSRMTTHTGITQLHLLQGILHRLANTTRTQEQDLLITRQQIRLDTLHEAQPIGIISPTLTHYIHGSYALRYCINAMQIWQDLLLVRISDIKTMQILHQSSYIT